MGIIAITMFVGVTFLAIRLGVKVTENNADLIGLPRQHPGHRHRPDRLDGLRRRDELALLLRAAGDRADPGAGREHRVQRLPGAGLDPRPGPVHAAADAQPRRPAGVQQRHRPAGAVRRRADLRLRRAVDQADPAVHRRGVRLVHVQPGRAWSGTGTGCCARRPTGPSGAPRTAAGRSARSRFVTTGTVLVVVLVTKFLSGAWIAIVAMVGDLVPHAGHPPPLRLGVGGDRRRRGRADHAAVPRALDRAGVQAAPTDAAGAGVRPGDPAVGPRGGDGRGRPGRGRRPSPRSGSGARSRCR